MLIAIDGPSASGKGTVGRKIAEHFGINYLDTGKLYRKVALELIKSGKKTDDEKSAIEIIKQQDFNNLDKENLYSEEIAGAAAVVAAIPAVRTALFDFQRKVASDKKGAVIDGRDIGTVVCPDADIKLFITASLEERAKRRYKELQKQDDSVIYDDVLQDLVKRDERDTTRKVSPMVPAKDAITIDTTNMNINQAFDKLLSVILSSAS